MNSSVKNSQLCRLGMTLVELMAALTLSSLLLAVVLGLVLRLSTTSTMLKQEMPYAPWKTALRRQLHEDYYGCRSILISPTKILIDGYAPIWNTDSETGVAPSRIEYFIVSDEQSSSLFRRQVNLLGSPSDNTRVELVCNSVVRFRSNTELRTDVAPGVLALEIFIAPENISDPTTGSTIERRYSSLLVSLVRHGGTEQ